ncbi:ABC transporter substrate-binding protein [Cellulomonas sp. Leaf334]|uniref:ABC transporter substrate-binding protein n=1 Tax=Cellulomonas sp. Leaf334 TaxID=1736339 RepID=UPI0006FF11B0|nr:ABC transporter substrate-binding protein [Cellulomonas sp. Leaf334]KQR11670.1 hypothetical protein ASF78_10520 [Cellulomonas sp. Leaf334]
MTAVSSKDVSVAHPPRLVRVHAATEPPMLNPLRRAAKSLATSVVSSCLLQSLNAVDARGRYTPQLLAEPPAPDDAGRRIAYRLRADARWHDGRPVSVRDVAFTHSVMMDPDSDIPERDGYDLIERIETVDDRSFVLHLSEAYPSYLDLFTSSTGSILPEHLLGGRPFTSSWDVEVRPSSGPFRLSTWSRGERLEVTAVDRDRAAATGIAGLTFRFGADAAQQIDDLIEGRADVASPDLDTSTLARVQDSGLSWGVGPGEQWEQLSFQHRNRWLSRRSLREAIAWSIDRDALAAMVPGTAEDGTRLDSLVRRPHHPDYRPAFARFHRDPRRAHDAAWRAGLDWSRGRLIGEGGEPVVLRLLLADSSRLRIEQAELIAGWLDELGVDVRLDVTSGRDLLHKLASADYDLALFGYAGNPDPVGHNTLWMADPAGGPPGVAVHGQNYAGYTSATVTDLLRQTTLEPDQRRRSQLFAAADEVMAQDLPSLPLFVFPSFVAWRPHLEGPTPYPYQAGPLWNVAEWTLRDLPERASGVHTAEQRW